MKDPLVCKVFRDALEAMKPGWVVSGDRIVGPDRALVCFEELHRGQSLGHVDVQFVLDEGDSNPIVLHDCVSGFGETLLDCARSAAHLWTQTTGAAVLELKYSRRGEFADHLLGSEDDGFSGWHAIQGAILGYGLGDSAGRLQQWWLGNPLLPRLSRTLRDALSGHAGPHGLKILFGGQDVAEVRLNGEAHEPSSRMLASLDWPRLAPAGFVRSYVVLVHRDAPE